MRMVALAALLACSAAHASVCTAPTIVVDPFQVADGAGTIASLSAMNGGRTTLGVVTVNTTVKVSGCVAEVGYRDPVLIVARELRRNECAYEHVLVHERGHVTIYQNALATLAERIKARTAAGEDLFAAAKAETLAVEAEQAAHDSPEEYATNETACGGAIPAIVRRASR